MDTTIEMARFEFNVDERPNHDSSAFTIDEFCKRGGLERVIVSPPVDGCVSIWDGHGHRIWKADDRDALSDALGRRTLAFRSGPEQSQFRYTALSPTQHLVVAIPEHHFESPPWPCQGGYGITVLDVYGRFADTDEIVPATDTQWRSFAWFLLGQFEQAASRGDRLDIALADPTCTATAIVSALAARDVCQIAAWTGLEDENAFETIANITLSRQRLHEISRALVDAMRACSISPLETLIRFAPRQGYPTTIA